MLLNISAEPVLVTVPGFGFIFCSHHATLLHENHEKEDITVLSFRLGYVRNLLACLWGPKLSEFCVCVVCGTQRKAENTLPYS